MMKQREGVEAECFEGCEFFFCENMKMKDKHGRLLTSNFLFSNTWSRLLFLLSRCIGSWGGVVVGRLGEVSIHNIQQLGQHQHDHGSRQNRGRQSLGNDISPNGGRWTNPAQNGHDHGGNDGDNKESQRKLNGDAAGNVSQQQRSQRCELFQVELVLAIHVDLNMNQ